MPAAPAAPSASAAGPGQPQSDPSAGSAAAAAAHSGAPQTTSAQPAVPAPGPYRPAGAQAGPQQSVNRPPAAAPAPQGGAQQPSTQQTGADSAAPTSPGGASAATAPTTGAAETPTGTWQSAAPQTSWQGASAYPSTPATYSAATGATADPNATRVPDRVERAVQSGADRIEILPAALTSAELLADIAAAHRAQLKSTSGMRGALNKVGFSLGLSPAEQRKQDRRGRIRTQLNTPYQIAVISVKGGVGRTTVTAALGSTFARLRPDRVVAIDANPDFGDLPTRTRSHPYGLTLRDLVRAPNLEAFSAVHSFTSINDADLAVIASPWSTEAVEALSGREYATAVDILRRHYNLMLVDCGTGVLDSATGSVLSNSDAVLVVTPATVGGVKGAVATLNWLNSHGMQHLISKSIVSIVHHHPVKPTVEVDQIEKLFATAQRPTFELPYDAHLAEGGEIDLRLLDDDTGLALEELAAALADSFPGSPMTSGGDRGAWL
ncbi:MinD/ParA family protein [Nocardia sp. NPDC052254]|uniref:AAA family ATPase n=1 Tax=Nocardia sp. NPDC052254 TaxID=3155681 RepID=UPI003444D40E